MIRFFKDLIIGYKSIIHASLFIIKNHLWLYFLIPLLLLVLVLLSGEYVFDSMVKSFDFTRLQQMEFNDLSYSEELYSMLQLAIQILIVFAVIKFNKYIVLIILTPVLTLLSAKTDSLLTGNIFPSSIKQVYSDVKRALKITLRNMLLYMAWVAAIHVISIVIIPFEKDIGFSRHFFNTVITFIIGCYYYGFSLIDYTNERRRLSIEESIKFVRKHSGLAFSLGSVYSALFFIPMVGIVISPIVCVVAATIGLSKIINLADNQYSKPKVKPE